MTIEEAIVEFEEGAKITWNGRPTVKAEECQQMVEWLKDYKQLLEQETCGDCISRSEALSVFRPRGITEDVWEECDVYKKLTALPSVTPQPKMGQWEWIFDVSEETPVSPEEIEYAGWGCSICHNPPDDICDWDDPNDPPTHKYCPNCGCKMQEVKG